jgi:hypothetical protein
MRIDACERADRCTRRKISGIRNGDRDASWFGATPLAVRPQGTRLAQFAW